MRHAPSTRPDHEGRVGLPAVVEQLLGDVVADGFTLSCCRPKAAPNALVACYEWDHCVDLLTIGDVDRITTARAPQRKRDTVDIFAPEVVVWAYEGPPVRALRAVLDVVHPAHPDAPTTDYPAPASVPVPRAQQRPMTTQPPSPGKAQRGRPGSPPVLPTHDGDRVMPGMVAVGPEIASWSPGEPVDLRLRLPAASQSPTNPRT